MRGALLRDDRSYELHVSRNRCTQVSSEQFLESENEGALMCACLVLSYGNRFCGESIRVCGAGELRSAKSALASRTDEKTDVSASFWLAGIPQLSWVDSFSHIRYTRGCLSRS
jgi:hypothetical protein